MGCQGGENLIKGTLSCRVAKHGLPRGGGGEILIKGMLSVRVAKDGLPRGGGKLIKGMLYLNLNH